MVLKQKNVEWRGRFTGICGKKEGKMEKSLPLESTVMGNYEHLTVACGLLPNLVLNESFLNLQLSAFDLSVVTSSIFPLDHDD